jgi:ABC-type glutathione transport system ATPase component
MVFASHSRELIRQLCNRAILMHHGRVIADGSPDEILEKYHELSTAPKNSSEPNWYPKKQPLEENNKEDDLPPVGLGSHV